jgi:hypothetical protein
MPFRSLNVIFDQSKVQSLGFANSAFGLEQCKFAPSGTLHSLRLVVQKFRKVHSKGIFQSEMTED